MDPFTRANSEDDIEFFHGGPSTNFRITSVRRTSSSSSESQSEGPVAGLLNDTLLIFESRFENLAYGLGALALFAIAVLTALLVGSSRRKRRKTPPNGETWRIAVRLNIVLVVFAAVVLAAAAAYYFGGGALERPDPPDPFTLELQEAVEEMRLLVNSLKDGLPNSEAAQAVADMFSRLGRDLLQMNAELLPQNLTRQERIAKLRVRFQELGREMNAFLKNPAYQNVSQEEGNALLEIMESNKPIKLRDLINSLP